MTAYTEIFLDSVNVKSLLNERGIEAGRAIGR